MSDDRERGDEPQLVVHEMKNAFVELAKVDVSQHVEMKGKFSYLSWPFAVRELRRAYPTATWVTVRFDGLPYMKTELGYFVEVSVTVEGVTLSQIHPVLDNRNQPINKPTPFEINTSIQRALVKAIALHGLGLHIYAGEDLPMESEPEPKINESQAANLFALMDEVGADRERFIVWLECGEIMNLPAKQYSFAVKALEKKRYKEKAE